MTPEERQQFNDMKKELEELKQFKKSLESSHSIPLPIDQAFRGRFGFSTINTSSKSATSENQAVNEGGTDTYSVLKPPDAFVQVKIGSTYYYIPVFT